VCTLEFVLLRVSNVLLVGFKYFCLGDGQAKEISLKNHCFSINGSVAFFAEQSTNQTHDRKCLRPDLL